jgi:hypothetical protein
VCSSDLSRLTAVCQHRRKGAILFAVRCIGKLANMVWDGHVRQEHHRHTGNASKKRKPNK